MAEKVFKVRGQRSRSCINCNGGGIPFDDVLSRLACLWYASDVNSCSCNTDVALLF